MRVVRTQTAAGNLREKLVSDKRDTLVMTPHGLQMYYTAADKQRYRIELDMLDIADLERKFKQIREWREAKGLD